MTGAPETHQARGAVFAAIALQTCLWVPTALVRALGAFSRMGAEWLQDSLGTADGGGVAGDHGVAIAEAVSRAARLYGHLCSCDPRHECGTHWGRVFEQLGPHDLLDVTF